MTYEELVMPTTEDTTHPADIARYRLVHSAYLLSNEEIEQILNTPVEDDFSGFEF